MDIATNICQKYTNFECVACVRELSIKLNGSVLKIDIRPSNSHARAFIVHKNLFPDSSISDTGLHYGFLLNDLVFDNLHHQGIPQKTWESNFLYRSPVHGGECVVTSNDITIISTQRFLAHEGK